MRYGQLIQIAFNALFDAGIKDTLWCNTYSITPCAFETTISMSNAVKSFVIEIRMESDIIVGVDLMIYSWFGLRKKRYEVFESLIDLNHNHKTFESQMELIAKKCKLKLDSVLKKPTKVNG